jgi:hypothetical protein
MFGTVMNYVSLRLLGLDPEMEVMQDTRAWIRKNGTQHQGLSVLGEQC